MSGRPGLFADLLVPAFQHLRLSTPGVDQPTRGQLRLQVIPQNVHDLVDRQAESVVEPTGQRDDTMSQRRLGHRIGHHRLDVLLALGAVVAMNRVFGDDRLDLFGDVFDDPRA